MIRLSIVARVLGLALILTGAACTSSPESPAPHVARSGLAVAESHQQDFAGGERLLVRSGSLTLAVDDPAESAVEVTRRIEAAGGLVEHSNATSEHGVSLRARVPADRLDATLDAIAALGDEKHRSLSAADVTDQVSDLEARLRNNLALRDRLQTLLERADDVKDVLAIEKELNRLQAQIESMQARYDRLQKDVAMSVLSVQLEQARILGPLGYLGAGLAWALSKLFVIR